MMFMRFGNIFLCCIPLHKNSLLPGVNEGAHHGEAGRASDSRCRDAVMVSLVGCGSHFSVCSLNSSWVADT